MHSAAAQGRADEIKRLCECECGTVVNRVVNNTNSNGDTPVFLAAAKGHTMCVKVLYEFGADLSFFTSDMRTPIYVAAKGGHLECLKFILDQNASLERKCPAHTLRNWNDWLGCKCLRSIKRTVDAKTPLFVAAEGGHTECIRVLHNFDPHVIHQQANGSGQTAVHRAAQKGQHSAIRILHELGADINKNCFPKILQFITDENRCAELRKDEHVHWTPVFWATIYGHAECIRVLHELGADIKTGTCDDSGVIGMTPMHYAASQGQAYCIRVLHELGVDILHNSQRYWGYRPLHFAASTGHPECIRVLSTLGADKHVDEATLNRGMSAVHISSWFGHAECIRALHALGADITKKDTVLGHSALHMAAGWGHTECIRVLLALGADINATTNNGYTAVNMAAAHGRAESIRILHFLGADISKNSPIVDAIDKGSMECIHTLVRLGTDLNELSEHVDEIPTLINIVLSFSGDVVAYMDEVYPAEMCSANEDLCNNIYSVVQGSLSLEQLDTISERSAKQLSAFVFLIVKDLPGNGTVGDDMKLLPKLMNVFLLGIYCLQDLLNLRMVCTATKQCCFPVPHQRSTELPRSAIESFLSGEYSEYIPAKYVSWALTILVTDVR